MIKRFVLRFDAKREAMRAAFRAKRPNGYGDIVRAVVEALQDDDDYRGCPDPSRIHRIDDGDYQGTLFFAIGATGYQPFTYFCVLVAYGSCSGCDAFQDIRGYGDEPPTEDEVSGYMNLALGIVQRMKMISLYSEEENGTGGAA